MKAAKNNEQVFIFKKDNAFFAPLGFVLRAKAGKPMARYAVNFLYSEGDNILATDGHRLHSMDCGKGNNPLHGGFYETVNHDRDILILQRQGYPDLRFPDDWREKTPSPAKRFDVAYVRGGHSMSARTQFTLIRNGGSFYDRDYLDCIDKYHELARVYFDVEHNGTHNKDERVRYPIRVEIDTTAGRLMAVIMPTEYDGEVVVAVEQGAKR